MIGQPAIALPEESFDTRRSQVVRAGRSPGVRGLVVWWEWSKPIQWDASRSIVCPSLTHTLTLLACAKRSRANGWAWVPVIRPRDIDVDVPPSPLGDAKRNE